MTTKSAGGPLLSQDEIGLLISSAGTAPSMHNTQPWRFEINGPVVDVILDEARGLPAADRSGRLILIGLGAATFNLRVAAASLGYETTFATEPDPDRPDIVTRVFLGSRRSPTPSLAALYGELRRRHTYRGPMMDLDVPLRVRDRMAAAARSEGGDLRWLDAAGRRQLGGILRVADDLDLHDEDRLTERQQWVGGERDVEGVPADALGPLPIGPATVRDLSAGFERPGRGVAAFEQQPLIGILTTPGDRPSEWLRAGMALQHALLAATSYDLAVSFLNQAVEYIHLRSRVQELVGQGARPQVILRVGYPARASAGTPRRSWDRTVIQGRPLEAPRAR
ncbi:nitroreductase [Kribbella qitaiheensis]|uniref:Nitroreductase n=1 Tax=Kribbella qitaiheensis TaxID=1544730 RepID=A0A7G6WSL0_9ACTN|nr:nitroreductase [Kribbella qitaiheensis]QNE16975.1 nitroreductase [Kribbella qitaiheensis]